MEDSQLKDYQGDYEEYLRKNSAEALIMSDKAAKARELQKSQIKSKSKVSHPPSQHKPAACIGLTTGACTPCGFPGCLLSVTMQIRSTPHACMADAC